MMSLAKLSTKRGCRKRHSDSLSDITQFGSRAAFLKWINLSGRWLFDGDEAGSVPADSAKGTIKGTVAACAATCKSTKPHFKHSANLSKEYCLLECIGSGSYGSAWRAKRLAAVDHEGSEVVVKVVSMDHSSLLRDRDLIRSEAVLMAALRHPNIVAYHDCYVSSEGRLHIVMEHCAGGSMDVALRRLGADRRWPEAEAMRVFVQLCLALHEMHSRRILHRDVKPANIFMAGPGEEGVVKLGDLGLAKELAARNSARSLVGTPSYMAPEVVASMPYDERCDVWSLGITMYEMCSGTRAYEDRDCYAVYCKIYDPAVSPEPLDEGSYSAPLRRLLDRMLAKRPRDRPSIAQILQEDLVRKHLVRHHEHVITHVTRNQAAHLHAISCALDLAGTHKLARISTQSTQPETTCTEPTSSRSRGSPSSVASTSSATSPTTTPSSAGSAANRRSWLGSPRSPARWPSGLVCLSAFAVPWQQPSSPLAGGNTPRGPTSPTHAESPRPALPVDARKRGGENLLRKVLGGSPRQMWDQVWSPRMDRGSPRIKASPLGPLHTPASPAQGGGSPAAEHRKPPIAARHYLEEDHQHDTRPLAPADTCCASTTGRALDGPSHGLLPVCAAALVPPPPTTAASEVDGGLGASGRQYTPSSLVSTSPFNNTPDSGLPSDDRADDLGSADLGSQHPPAEVQHRHVRSPRPLHISVPGMQCRQDSASEILGCPALASPKMVIRIVRRTPAAKAASRLRKSTSPSAPHKAHSVRDLEAADASATSTPATLKSWAPAASLPQLLCFVCGALLSWLLAVHGLPDINTWMHTLP